MSVVNIRIILVQGPGYYHAASSHRGPGVSEPKREPPGTHVHDESPLQHDRDFYLQL